MKVLITGGRGNMAQGIKRILEKKNYEIYTPSRKELDITNFFQVYYIMQGFRPNILINCAGFIEPSSIKDTALDIWLKHLEVNLSGAFYCSKYAILNGCKIIINIGSTSAFEGRENWGAYCCAKAGIMSLTETLAREGYTSYCIHPARTATKMRKRLFPNEDPKTLMNPERIGKFILKCLKREFTNGSHIIVKKNYFYVLPMRECLK